MLPVGEDDLEALNTGLGGFYIAAVCKVPAALGRDDGHALGNVESGGIVAAVPGGQ